MKKCSKCKKEKEESEFLSIPAYRDGLYPKCKSCLIASGGHWTGPQSNNRCTPELVQAITNAYLSGYKYREISRDYGVSITAISTVMRNAGIKPNRGKGRKVK